MTPERIDELRRLVDNMEARLNDREWPELTEIQQAHAPTAIRELLDEVERLTHQNQTLDTQCVRLADTADMRKQDADSDWAKAKQLRARVAELEADIERHSAEWECIVNEENEAALLRTEVKQLNGRLDDSARLNQLEREETAKAKARVATLEGGNKLLVDENTALRDEVERLRDIEWKYQELCK